MLAKHTAKVSVSVDCPGCMGGGTVNVFSSMDPHIGENRVCRGCFGRGSIVVLVEDEDADLLWDEAVTMLELVGVDVHPEAYRFQWRGDRWAVVDYDQAKKGSLQ